LLGYGVLTWSWSIEIGGPEAVLDELYVRTRNRGIGGRLVEALVAAGREHGMRRIFLETERPNEAARRLYERHGFVTDDSIWMARLLDGARNGP
jgi:ribosomal protein S18 acetylase RimI-like enzyme